MVLYMSNLFENNYSQYIEPIYGNKRNPDEDNFLTKNLHADHIFKITKRIDFTHQKTFSIDPDGCLDADDAFSIYDEYGKLYLAIHIADPTDYIDITSPLWGDILNRTTTKYLSNRPPIHMMPDDLLEVSSLMENKAGSIKNAITILTEINVTTYTPIGNIQILFTKIKVSKENALTYYQASISKLREITIGLNIAKVLKTMRSKKTKGVILNDLSMAYTKYSENDIFLQVDSIEEKEIKQMIAEFAIFSNSFVGEYLKINLNMGIFRTCPASEWLKTLYNGITPEEMITEIITNGIKADYLSNSESHDLVGMPEYCHFTSPIRRLADCICHYLLKYIHLRPNVDCPFIDQQLNQLANKCLSATKKDKKNQYLDIKFRLLQFMHKLVIQKSNILIEYYVTSYKGLFLNLIISKIEEYNIHMSYTLRIPFFEKEIKVKEKKNLVISKINCFVKYDQGTIPELDEVFLLSTVDLS